MITARGWGLALAGAGGALAGWRFGWPELTAIAASAFALVLIAVAMTSGVPTADIELESTDLRAVRGEPMVLWLTLNISRRHRGLLRLVDRSPGRSEESFVVPRARGQVQVELGLTVDTGKRGTRQVGPFALLREDPWSLVRKPICQSPKASLLVRPRTFPVRKNLVRTVRPGDTDAMSQRSGDDHFFALRDYVLGDEPRSVHWRSSARSGRLVVKQKVAAAVDGTLIVLDTDMASYPSIDSFAEAFVAERFEVAVEVAASLCQSRGSRGERVTFVTTARAQATVGRELTGSARLDALALLEPTAPLDSEPSALPSLARRSQCSQLIVVTGAPSADLLGVLRRCGSLSPVLVRVAGVPTGPVAGMTVLDLPDAKALA